MKAQNIYNYMVARAKSERLPHDLPPEFYQAGLDLGCRCFFGVELDDDGNLLIDRQNPRFFRSYMGYQ